MESAHPAVKKDEDPPLVDVKVANPVTYIKKWWAKLIGNEGIYISFKVKPLTAIIIGVIVTTAVVGVGGWTISETTMPKASPTPIPEEWKETAFTGTLRYSEETESYYLVTTSSAEAITLEVPDNLKLETLVGRRIFLAGKYNKSKRILTVSDAADTEILPKSPEPVPTEEPIISPTPQSEPSPTASGSAESE